MNIYLKYLLVIAWMLIIFLLSNEVAGTSDSRSDVIVNAVAQVVSWPENVLEFLTRKAAHSVAYFVLGVLIYNVVRMYKLDARRAILLSITLACAYAISDEVHQIFVPGRSGEVRDVVIDTVAAAVGVMLCKVAVQSKILTKK